MNHASRRSANFLTVLAGRTVKISPSPIGRGFEPGRRQDFSDRSILDNENNDLLSDTRPEV